MTAQDFVAKWRRVDLSERSAVQQHFLDLCALVGHPPPAEYDPTGHEFAFEMGASEADLKKRTLTNLYNTRPKWLANAHAAVDEAVAEAYGWGDDWHAGMLTDDEILARLFAINQARAAA